MNSTELVFDAGHPFDESWREVIRRRSKELRCGLVTRVPWEEVKRLAREKASGRRRKGRPHS